MAQLQQWLKEKDGQKLPGEEPYALRVRKVTVEGGKAQQPW